MNKNHKQKQITKVDTTAVPSEYAQRRSEIIAAIPCFNEEIFIGSVVLKTKDYVDQVVVIDDGSTDKTATVAEKAGAVVISHGPNKGKGAAVSTAFDYARNACCKALVLLDGDGQHDPAYIPALVKPVLDDKADMVVGSRYLGVKSSIPGYRIWGHRVLTLLSNLGSRVKLTDSQSGLRAFSTKAMEALRFAEEGLSVESEMQFLANESGLRTMEVPISVGYYGKSKRSPLAHGVGVLNSILGLIGKRIPLFFFGVPGVLMLAFGFWEGWRVIQGWNTYHAFWLGPALIAVLLCVVGALSLFTGLILHTIKSFLK
ncbi:MAG: glycosyltransferase family 2 protein [Methanotrichaceae archaeon]|nr:glycosyltransferase family 2 protein [Methanotrichaceae archaeon]